MNKTLLGVTVCAVMLGGVHVYSNSEVVVENIITETVVQEVDATEVLIENALNASSTEHAVIAQEAHDAKLANLRAAKRLQVLQAQNELLAGEIESIEKELGVY